MTITPDGKVVLCDTIPQEGIFVVGDVTAQSIMDVWNSEELLNFALSSSGQIRGFGMLRLQRPNRMSE